MRRGIDIGVLALTAPVLALFTFGVAASVTVPFSHSAVPVHAAIHSLADLRPGQVLGERLFWFLIPAVVLIFAFLHTRRRLLVSAICLLLPALWLDLARCVAQFMYLPFAAVSTTVRGFARRLDGESWSEGLVALSAMGYWIVIWLVVVLLETWRTRRTVQADTARSRESPSPAAPAVGAGQEK